MMTIFGKKTGRSVKIEYSNHKGHIRGSKHVYETYIGDDASAVANCGRAKYSKKEEREKGTHNSGKLAIRPYHPRRLIKIKHLHGVWHDIMTLYNVTNRFRYSNDEILT